MSTDALTREAADIADRVAERKRIATTVFNAAAKAYLATSRGLPPDTYYNLPFAEWAELKRKG